MNIVLLTGTELRHKALQWRLETEGFNVVALAEKKGKSFNESSFYGNNQVYLNYHTENLNKSQLEIFDDINVSEFKFQPKVFERGIFKEDFSVELIESYSPDLIIVFGCGIIGSRLIEKFSNKLIGSHQGLPQYFRGSGSNFFACCTGQFSRMGVSIHYINSGIDTGKIITQFAGPPLIYHSYYSYSAWLIKKTFDLFCAVIHSFSKSYGLPSTQLVELGSLYQRKDFTPDVLLLFLNLIENKNFYYLYEKSLESFPVRLISSI